MSDVAVTTGRPVDLVHLARQTFGNKDLETEVLLLFLRQSALMMQRFETGADARGWRETAHTVRGSALGIGAWKVADAARAVETMPLPPTDPAARAALAELARAVEDANRYIRELVAA